MDAPELAASGLDFRTFPIANGDLNPHSVQNVSKPPNVTAVRGLVRKSLDRVVRNQVHKGISASQQLAQFLGMLRPIINVADNNIFVRDAPTRFGKVIIRGLENRLDPDPTVCGDQPISQFVI